MDDTPGALAHRTGQPVDSGGESQILPRALGSDVEKNAGNGTALLRIRPKNKRHVSGWYER